MQLFLKQVGNNIRSARLAAGFRQVDVEERCGLDYRHYQKIESGKVNLTLETLCRLAGFFKVPVEQLVRPDAAFVQAQTDSPPASTPTPGTQG